MLKKMLVLIESFYSLSLLGYAKGMRADNAPAWQIHNSYIYDSVCHSMQDVVLQIK